MKNESRKGLFLELFDQLIVSLYQFRSGVVAAKVEEDLEGGVAALVEKLKG